MIKDEIGIHARLAELLVKKLRSTIVRLLYQKMEN